jgi:eukaryotic-like serine/threonine-protein kinase
VNLIDYGTGASGLWFAMELCRGGDLEQFLSRRGGRLAIREGVALVLELLDGLGAAHARGIVHRDLEPRNMLFEQIDAGPVKIANFGLAKSFLTAGLSGFTVTGASSPGTPEFMPRELVVNFKYVKPHSDVWSMAAVLYLLLTGRLPRDPDPTQDPLSAVLTSPVVPIRDRSRSIPRRLAELIDGCLATDAAARPVDAGDMRRQLLAAIEPASG